MNASDFYTKAQRALATAELALQSGDMDGACNRAYYAMFAMAKAALMSAGAPFDPAKTRSHGGLIAAFSEHLVKSGRVPVHLGRSLNKVEDLRLIADYKGEPIENEQAVWAAEQANLFVSSLAQEFRFESIVDGEQNLNTNTTKVLK